MTLSTKGLLIGVGGMLAGTPDALVLRWAIGTGATLRIVLFWRFVMTLIFNLVFVVLKHAGSPSEMTTAPISSYPSAVAVTRS